MQVRIAVELVRATLAIVGPALPMARGTTTSPTLQSVTKALVQRLPVPGTNLETRLYLIT
jgi:hypothetical protein